MGKLTPYLGVFIASLLVSYAFYIGLYGITHEGMVVLGMCARVCHSNQSPSFPVSNITLKITSTVLLLISLLIMRVFTRVKIFNGKSYIALYRNKSLFVVTIASFVLWTAFWCYFFKDINPW